MSNKKKIIKLLAMQINSHVDGDTKHSDKILSLHETMLSIGEIMISVQSITQYIR